MPEARQEYISEIKKGNPIFADWMNQIVRRVNERSYSAGFDSRIEGPRIHVKNTTGAALPAYSLLGAEYADTPFANGAIKLKTLLTEEAEITVTNGRFPVAIDAEFIPVSLSEPQKVEADPDVTAWPIGEFIGRKVGDVVAGLDEEGPLICLSALEGTKIWVYAPIKPGSGGPKNFLAVLIEELKVDSGLYPTGSMLATTSIITGASEDLREYVGYKIIVEGAGEDGGELITTIASAPVSGSVVLADAAQTSVSGAELTILSVADAYAVERASNGRLVQQIEEDAPRIVEVVNRNRFLSLEPDTLLTLHSIGGEYHPLTADCEPSEWEWPPIPLRS